jgi:hypothetical protein
MDLDLTGQSNLDGGRLLAAAVRQVNETREPVRVIGWGGPMAIVAPWREGRPPEHGYFLAAWRRAGLLVVSELWFNPDSTGSGWWSSRGYLGDRLWESESLPVVAWMPMPAPPVETPR